MDITIRIESPSIAEAINNLATAIASKAIASIGVPATSFVTPVEIPAPVAPQMAPPVTAPVQPGPAVPVAGQTVDPVAGPGGVPEPVPTTIQTYTLEQLAVAATQLVDAGRRNELVNLLGQFGVQALTALPKEQYGNFATALRQLGARI